jgi:drug/metabolite transporter (DMT)-like permease
MAEQNNRIGILMFCMAMFIFAAQDGISRHLGSHYNVFSIVMLRYWVFAAFGVWLLLRAHGSIRPAFATPHPVRQAIRGLLLAVQICIMQLAFVTLGLIESHAVFVTAPLIVAALSGPLLGEKVGWRRWTAIGVGCVGVLVVLKPGAGVILPLVARSTFGRLSLCTLRPSDPLCWPRRQQRHQLFLDGNDGCAGHDCARTLAVATHDSGRFFLDGHTLLHRHHWPLVANPQL